VPWRNKATTAYASLAKTTEQTTKPIMARLAVTISLSDNGSSLDASGSDLMDPSYFFEILGDRRSD
jgi:hypothetical protein